MTLELERKSDQFDVKEFERYSREMKTLCEIISNLKFLLNRSERLTYSGKDESLRHHEYFNEETDKYIESMLKYVVKQQKELVDNMYSKLELDEVDIYDLPELPNINEIDENK